MKREELISLVGKPLLKPIGIANVLSWLSIISMPILWAWVNWALAWRVGITGFVCVLITTGLYTIVEKSAEQVVDEVCSKESTKSSFQQRIEEKMKKSNSNC